MKKNLKLLALVLCLTLFATMALGSGSSDSGENETTENNAEDTSAVTIEEQVLFEGNDIKITATGMEDGLLKLVLQNLEKKRLHPTFEYYSRIWIY